MLGKARYKVVSNVPNVMQESSATKSELTVRAATQVSTATHPCRLAVAYRVALDLGLKKEVQSVGRVMRECLVMNLAKPVRIVMWDSTVQRRTTQLQLAASHVLPDTPSTA